MHPAIIDLSAVIAEVAHRYEVPAAKMGCQFTAHITPGIVGLWDSLAIEQIVDNLLSNAVKYGAGTPVNLSLTDTGEAAVLVVQDRGPGISVPDRERIFARFERVVAPHDQGGFGIGLWVVRQLIEAMGGKIEIYGAAGEGSTFTVQLPKRR